MIMSDGKRAQKMMLPLWAGPLCGPNLMFEPVQMCTCESISRTKDTEIALEIVPHGPHRRGNYKPR